MSMQRSERVQEALRQEISNIIQFEMKDPRIGFLTITKVELTKDLRYAKVYFSVLGKDQEKQLTLKGLNSAKGYIKGLIADRLKLRFAPEISFKIDDSLAYTQEICELLDRLEKEKDNAENNRGDKEE